MKLKLLDHLAKHCKAHYISDLKNKTALCVYREYILDIDETLYALEDWKDVCEYILGEKKEISSISQAKKMIIDWLNS
ncbi:hypothetical protein [Amedibacillus sp. YH-ame10]